MVPAGSGWQSRAFSRRYCAYIEPPTIDTSLPLSACAASEEPDLTTVPAPSLPTGSDSPRRVARNGRAAADTGAVTFTPSPLPLDVAFVRSAGPVSRPRSDGLIGVASTLTTTWSGPGSGTSTRASDSSSRPSVEIRERSCSPDSFVASLMSDLPLVEGAHDAKRHGREQAPITSLFAAVREGSQPVHALRVVEKASTAEKATMPNATQV